MKYTLLILFLSIFFQLPAQLPIINRTNYFETGDSFLLFHKFDTSLSNISVGPSGTNVQWDYSALDFGHPSVTNDTLIYISPIGTPFYPICLSADYSLSNFCLYRTADKDYNYYYSNNDSIAFIGHWASNGLTELWEDHCTNFIKELIFPFSYQDNFLDNYVRYYFDMSGSDGHYITGTNSVTADGYGSLITPEGATLSNVLRIHSILTVRDSNFLFGISYFTRHYYSWWSSDKKGFILSMAMTLNNAEVETADYQKQINDNNTSVSTMVTKNHSLMICPNPSNGQFTFSIKVISNIRLIEIYNAFGQRVYSENNSNQQNGNSIDISGNAQGIYFLKIYEGERMQVSKIVIQ